MNKQNAKRTILLSLLICVCHAALAHDFDLVETAIGDSRLATLGGYSLARPISIEVLSLTNENGQVTSYSIGARIVYKDLRFEHPTQADWPQQQTTSDLLNEWLAEYVHEECADADLDTLCESYLRKDFVRMLQDRFPSYVEARIDEMPQDERVEVEAVTIDMLQAEGAFRDELIQRKALNRNF